MPIISNFPGGSGSGGGLALAAVSNIKTQTAHGRVYIQWADPEDLVAAGSTLVSWDGTLLVRKAGSMPASRRDGVVVLDSKTRDAYKSSYFCDSGLTDGTTYYYKLFPYTTDNSYTDTDDGGFSAIPNAVAVGDVSGITSAPAGNGKMAIKWTDPAATVVQDGLTLATWASTVVVVKEDAYATSPTDPDAAFTYTSTTRNGHAANALIATGLTNGKTYYISLFPMSTDGKANTSAVNRNTGVANRLVISSVPAQSGTLTYNGNSQTPAWSNYDSAQLTLGGAAAGTNAASYNAAFSPKDDYMWSDGTTAAKTVSWSIGRAAVAVPTTSSSFTYDGNQKSPAWSGYDSAKMTLGGTSSATNAGTYTATFTPTDNYKWSDGATTARTVSWSIGKAAGSLSLSTSAVTLNPSNLTAAVTVTRPGDGAVAATSSNTSVATVSVSGTTVTISHVNQTTGTAIITIKVAAGTNHTAPADKTVTVTTQFVSRVLNDNTWSVISDVSSKGQGSNYWSVGDRKAVLVNGTVGTLAVNQTLYVYILGFNHNSAKEGNGIHFGTFKTALSGGVDVCLVDSFCGNSLYNDSSAIGTKYFQMNHWENNGKYGGWKACDMRYDVLGSTNKAPSGYGTPKTPSAVGYDASTNTATNPVANTLMAALPSDLRTVMKPITKYTDNRGLNSSATESFTASVDYLPLLSEFEVFGKQIIANIYEKDYQVQYEYYKAGNTSRKFKYNSTNNESDYWGRSFTYRGDACFCCLSSNRTSQAASSFSRGLSPIFMV